MKLKFSLSLFFVLLCSCFKMILAIESFDKRSTNDFNSSIPVVTDSLLIIKKQIGSFAKKKDYGNAIYYSKKLLKKAEMLSDSTIISNALWRQGFYFKRLDKLDSAYFYFDKAYSINIKLKDSIAVGDRLLDMANIQKSLGDYNGSMITAIDGLKYLDGSNEVESTFGLYQTISVAQKELGNYKEALRWNNKIFSLLKNHPAYIIDKESAHTIKITRANILAKQNEFAVSYGILDSIVKNSEGKNQFQYARAICNLGYYKWLENNNNLESESLLLNSLQIRQALNTASGLISSNVHLAEYYFDTDKAKALNYAEQAFSNSKEINNSVAILESLDLVLPLKKELGLDVSEEAILYSNVQNKLEKTKQSIRSIYAATKYDNDTLEKKNLVLLAQVAIREKQGIIVLSIAGLLLFLIGFIIYYKNQQKKREQLEQNYKTELRLSKKIHDELGNDIHYLMTQVQKDPEYHSLPQSGVILNSLDGVYKRIRDISKDFTPINTDNKFGDDFTMLLNSYSSNTIKIITKEIPEDFWNPVAKQTKIELFRVVQELLTNMKKHSSATLVAITCSKNNKEYTIKYVDNGIGFNQKETSLGIGMKNAENRMQDINGSINFETKPNEGVSATITFSI